MIDRLIGRNSERKHSTYDPNYSPKDVVVGESLTNLSADTLTVVFPSWHSNDLFDKALDHRLARHGLAVYRPEIHHQILEPNIDRVVASFMQLQKTVSDRIHELVSQNRYNSVSLLAMSLGNVSLTLVAEAYPDFDSANMMMAGSSLARSLWQGERTQSLRGSLVEQGVTEGALDEAWTSLAPKTHADCFSDKSVDLLVSKNDKVIPTVLQHEMVNELVNSGANSSVRYTELGHYMSIITRSLVTI
jgi:predicted peptidase